MTSVSGDLLTEILGRVDGVSLANARIVCSEFWSTVRQECLWEDKCRSLWPSTGDKHVKELIFSLGGFKKFYANCFPLIACESMDSKRNDMRNLHKDSLCPTVPSDFVSVVDVHHKNRLIFSKVVWGIPDGDDFQGWFSNCPFRIDLINFSDVQDEDRNIAHDLPTMRVENQRSGDDNFWGELMENIRLSWILINRKTGQAANLSSWTPLAGKRHWPCNKDFVLRFGSILPGHDILSCKVVKCIVDMKCRLFHGDHTCLKIIELSMHLEDMMGAHVNGVNSLLIIERGLRWKKSIDHSRILQSYEKCLAEQRELRKAKTRSDDRLNSLCIASGIAASASFWYFLLRKSSGIM